MVQSTTRLSQAFEGDVEWSGSIIGGVLSGDTILARNHTITGSYIGAYFSGATVFATTVSSTSFAGGGVGVPGGIDASRIEYGKGCIGPTAGSTWVSFGGNFLQPPSVTLTLKDILASPPVASTISVSTVAIGSFLALGAAGGTGSFYWHAVGSST